MAQHQRKSLDMLTSLRSYSLSIPNDTDVDWKEDIHPYTYHRSPFPLPSLASIDININGTAYRDPRLLLRHTHPTTSRSCVAFMTTSDAAFPTAVGKLALSMKTLVFIPNTKAAFVINEDPPPPPPHGQRCHNLSRANHPPTPAPVLRASRISESASTFSRENINLPHPPSHLDSSPHPRRLYTSLEFGTQPRIYKYRDDRGIEENP